MKRPVEAMEAAGRAMALRPGIRGGATPRFGSILFAEGRFDDCLPFSARRLALDPNIIEG